MDQNQELLERRVANVLPTKTGLTNLLATKKIRLYQGFDPTGARLHLGHTIGMRKLMDFARLGHEVIFLFGTGTVLVGDPSERNTGRKLITQDEIDQNIKNWQQQVAPIVDFNLVTIKQNGDWLTKLTLKDIVHIASNISAIQLFKRESFTRRLKNGDTVWYHETMYPLLQGYDSVVMDVDLEVGGTDQEFNMLIGRELQHKLNHKEKFILTTPMIMGTDGQPMSKTSNNCIWLDDSPEDMYGKLMSIPDDQIDSYLRLLTNIPLEEIDHLPPDPMANKKLLALDVTTQFYGHEKASAAAKHFETTVQSNQAPDDIPTINLNLDQNLEYSLLELCKNAGVGESNGQIKRTIEQGGVKWNDQKITDPFFKIKFKHHDILKFGKRRWLKIITN